MKHTISLYETFEHIPNPKTYNTNKAQLDKYKKFTQKVMENGITKNQKKFLELYYFNNLNMPQIAKKYGISVSTVSRTISRGKNKIKKFATMYFDN